MTLIIPNGYGQMTLKWRYIPLSRDMTVTFGFFDSAGTAGANAACTSWRNQLTAIGGPANASAMGTNWQQTGSTCLLRDSLGNLIAGLDTTVVTGSGSSATATQPVYLPLVVTKVTAFAGKAHRGRIYPPLTLTDETTVDAGGSLTGPAVSALQTQWGGFLAAINAGPYPARLLHGPPGGGLSPDPVLSLAVRPVAGIQRRRRNRGA
jgi:hypothetical protein